MKVLTHHRVWVWWSAVFGLYAGQLEAARCLLSAGANIHVADRSGDTPLLLAAKGGHADVVTLLMSARADPHAVNKLGWSALIGAAACGSCATLRVLLASSGGGGGGGGFDLDASIEAAAALHEHQQPHRRGNEFNGTASDGADNVVAVARREPKMRLEVRLEMARRERLEQSRSTEEAALAKAK